MPLLYDDRIVMMEDHDKAYAAWKERRIRGRTLVHVDAHIDFGWIPGTDMDEIVPDSAPRLLNPFITPRKQMVNIGNYICPAIMDGIVRKFYWVVPDKSWERRGSRKHIIRQLQGLLRMRRPACGTLEWSGPGAKCRIAGVDLIVCPLKNLEDIREPALLDIDVDFMLTEDVRRDIDPGRSPWIFPDDLYRRVTAKVRSIDVLTVAYSVEGGFTPLKFKHFGDDLRCFFKGDTPGTLDLKKKALSFENRHRIVDARAAYSEALRVDPRDASVYFNLALLDMDGSQAGEARAVQYYNEAVRLDRSYATRYNNCGILYLQQNKLPEAERAYRRYLRLNGSDPAALCGLGFIALARRRYAQASGFFAQCMGTDASYCQARFGAALVRYKTGRFGEAESLFNGLKNDYPYDAEPFWWLGRIAQKRRDPSSAIRYYKDGVIRGGEGPLVHIILARLYAQKRLYFRACEELKRSVRVLRSLSR